MKKVFAILLSLLMLLSVVACGGQTGPAPSGENQKPVIKGAQDATVEAGQSFDALAGVTATDAEDGDITGLITVESTPTLDFKGGKATPENAGSYELVYSVTDKAGATAEAYATLTVTKKTGDAVLLKEFDFSTAETADAHGWEAVVDGAEAAGALKQGAYVIDITNPGSALSSLCPYRPELTTRSRSGLNPQLRPMLTSFPKMHRQRVGLPSAAKSGTPVWMRPSNASNPTLPLRKTVLRS